MGGNTLQRSEVLEVWGGKMQKFCETAGSAEGCEFHVSNKRSEKRAGQASSP